METVDKVMLKYVRGSLEAFLENKRSLNWIKGVIKKSGILGYKGLLRNIFEGLEPYKESVRYREILRESLREGWMELSVGVVADILSWKEWDDLLKKTNFNRIEKGVNFKNKDECIEFWIGNRGNNYLKYIGLAYPDRSLSSEKEAIICLEVDKHIQIEQLYREWREGKMTHQKYRQEEEELRHCHSSTIDWMKRKYQELKTSKLKLQN